MTLDVYSLPGNAGPEAVQQPNSASCSETGSLQSQLISGGILCTGSATKVFCMVPALEGRAIPEGFLLRDGYQPQLKSANHIVRSMPWLQLCFMTLNLAASSAGQVKVMVSSTAKATASQEPDAGKGMPVRPFMSCCCISCSAKLIPWYPEKLACLLNAV